MIIAYLPLVCRRGCDHIELITQRAVSQVKKHDLVLRAVYDVVDSRAPGINNEVDGKQMLANAQPLTIVNAPLAAVVDFLDDITKQHI